MKDVDTPMSWNGYVVLMDMKKAEVLNTFFAFVLTGMTGLQQFQVLETSGCM